MKDNTEQALSHCFLSTHAQHFFNTNVNDVNIQRSRLCMNKVKTDQGTWIKDLLYGHKEDFFLRELRRVRVAGARSIFIKFHVSSTGS